MCTSRTRAAAVERLVVVSMWGKSGGGWEDVQAGQSEGEERLVAAADHDTVFVLPEINGAHVCECAPGPV